MKCVPMRVYIDMGGSEVEIEVPAGMGLTSRGVISGVQN